MRAFKLSENSPYFPQIAMDDNNKKTDLSKNFKKVEKISEPTPPAGNTKIPSPTAPVPTPSTSVKSPESKDIQSKPTMPNQPIKPTPPNKPTAADVANAAREKIAAANANTAQDPSPVNTTNPVSKPSPKLPPKLPASQPATTVQDTSLQTSNQSEVQTLTPLQPDHKASLAQPLKPVSRWAFWKKAKQRDEQLIRISEGYVEMVDMVRSIRDQADAQYQNNLILRESLIHLPDAIQSLEGFGKSHEQVGSALEKINEQMKTNLAKDERMANTMEGFNDTLKGMNGTTKATIQTFDRVQERMRDSDIRMENLFSNVRQSEEKVSESMTRLQRNMSIFQAFFLLCLLGIIGGLIYLFINKDDFTTKPQELAPIQQQAVQPSNLTTPPPAIVPSADTPVEEPPSIIAPETTSETTPSEVSSDIVPSDIYPADLVPEDIQPSDLTSEKPATENPVEEPLAEEPQVETTEGSEL